MNKFEIYKNKVVLITGNSGFKGSWLSAWLLKLGAKIVGLSLDVPSQPSNFEAAALERKISHVWGDVRNLADCAKVINSYQPDFVFHLAAQPLVRCSYLEPHDTFMTNAGGTLNILEALRLSNHSCTAVFITSDKSYDNVEQIWGYRENDRVGGKDPYSGSKGAAELIIRSYTNSFFSDNSRIRIGVARAGNVIGGGDWADNRIIADAARAWSSGKILHIRNPRSTRPWQHVLEPLAGYLTLAADLLSSDILMGEAFNFGPPADQIYTVSDLLQQMQVFWPGATWHDTSNSDDVYEAGLLKLCCDKAQWQLGWKPILTFEEVASLTANWYRAFYRGNVDIWTLTQDHIAQYEALGQDRGVIWAA